MKSIEEKIRAKQYKSIGIASAAVKRADISARERSKLLELVDQMYRQKPQPDSDPSQPDIKLSDGRIIRPPRMNPFRTPEPSADKLDQQLLKIAFQLLGLCLEHGMSREEIYKRLEARLMAGMG